MTDSRSRFVDDERTVQGGWKPLPAHIQAALQKKRDRKSKPKCDCKDPAKDCGCDGASTGAAASTAASPKKHALAFRVPMFTAEDIARIARTAWAKATGKFRI
jgi:hypothetical protein